MLVAANANHILLLSFSKTASAAAILQLQGASQDVCI